MHHKEEITKLLEEYDDQKFAHALELDSYERECCRQEGEQDENKDEEREWSRQSSNEI